MRLLREVGGPPATGRLHGDGDRGSREPGQGASRRAEDLASCHTALVDGYVVEGHVPADAIRRLLAERPKVTGLAVPGMPAGSPGMEVEGREPDIYEVVLFGPEGRGAFARYRGGAPA